MDRYDEYVDKAKEESKPFQNMERANVYAILALAEAIRSLRFAR